MWDLINQSCKSKNVIGVMICRFWTFCRKRYFTRIDQLLRSQLSERDWSLLKIRCFTRCCCHNSIMWLIFHKRTIYRRLFDDDLGVPSRSILLVDIYETWITQDKNNHRSRLNFNCNHTQLNLKKVSAKLRNFALSKP